MFDKEPQKSNTMKQSEQALALCEKRNRAIRAKYDELLKQNRWSQSEIYYQLSEQFYLLERQIQYIIRGK